MIVVKIMGGIGNQMFQYALGKCLALKHDTQLKLDTSSFINNPNRRFLLPEYHTSIVEIEPEKTPYHIRETRPNKFHSLFSHMLPHKLKVYKEPHFHFDDHAINCKDNTYLYGYWQSEKYFKSVEKTILSEFRSKTPILNAHQNWIDRIAAKNSVAVHVRRGDYLNHNKLVLLNVTYYNNALKFVSKKTFNPTFFIFSDDIDWCKANLDYPEPTYFVDTLNDLADFELMRLCNHHVIANSTFSWWASYLSSEKKGITVAPREWFIPNTSFDTKDLYIDKWYLI